MDNTVLIIVIFIVGIILGYVLSRLSAGDSSKRINELKSEITNVRKSNSESLEQVNTAIENVKGLALNMLATYKSLEATKATLEGREEDAKLAKETLNQLKEADHKQLLIDKFVADKLESGKEIDKNPQDSKKHTKDSIDATKAQAKADLNKVQDLAKNLSNKAKDNATVPAKEEKAPEKAEAATTVKVESKKEENKKEETK